MKFEMTIVKYALNSYVLFFCYNGIAFLFKTFLTLIYKYHETTIFTYLMNKQGGLSTAIFQKVLVLTNFCKNGPGITTKLGVFLIFTQFDFHKTRGDESTWVEKKLVFSRL